MSAVRKHKSNTPFIVLMLVTAAAVFGIAYYVLKDDLYFLQKKSTSPDKSITLYIKQIQTANGNGYRISRRVEDSKLMYYEWTASDLQTVWSPDSTKCAVVYETSAGQVTEVLECDENRLIQASSMSALSLRYHMGETGFELSDEIGINVHFTGWQDGNIMKYTFDTVNTSGIEITGEFAADYADGFKVVYFSKN